MKLAVAACTCLFSLGLAAATPAAPVFMLCKTVARGHIVGKSGKLGPAVSKPRYEAPILRISANEIDKWDFATHSWESRCRDHSNRLNGAVRATCTISAGTVRYALAPKTPSPPPWTLTATLTLKDGKFHSINPFLVPAHYVLVATGTCAPTADPSRLH